MHHVLLPKTTRVHTKRLLLILLIHAYPWAIGGWDWQLESVTGVCLPHNANRAMCDSSSRHLGKSNGSWSDMFRSNSSRFVTSNSMSHSWGM